MFDFKKEDIDDVMQPARHFIDKVKELLNTTTQTITNPND